jgi:hypothetical protein
MQTGILTFHRGPNYGGFLQAWHMREAVRSLGHEATLVNYQKDFHHRMERVRLKGLHPKALKGSLLHYLKSKPFAQPVAELSDHAFSRDATSIDWRAFDRIVVGADVVWDFSNPTHGTDPVFFGAHPSQADTSFVAYAPSCGETAVDGELPDFVTSGLNRFQAFNVRDETTAALVKKATGKESQLVVDPTWLQEDPDIPYPKRPRSPYALVYGHGVDVHRAAVLSQHCKKRGVKLVSCAFPCKTADRFILSIDPFGWVDLFRRAECVVTSTFHGLLYAIKYNKPVIFMVRGPSRSKSKLAIERCGISDRVIEEGEPFTEELLDFALNPARGTQLPEAWIRESRERLEASLR